MRSPCHLNFAFLMITVLTTPCFGQTYPQQRDFTLRVQSADDPTAKLTFTGSYFFGDSLNDPQLVTLVKETPFVLEFSAQYFLGMFQDKDGKNGIEVSLESRAMGKPVAKASGQGPVNVLRAERGMISWGFPSASTNLRRR